MHIHLGGIIFSRFQISLKPSRWATNARRRFVKCVPALICLYGGLLPLPTWAGEWSILEDNLRTLKIDSSAASELPPADVTLQYSKPGAEYVDNAAFVLGWNASKPIDLTQFRRLSGSFTAKTAEGYYSGRTALVFVDSKKRECAFMLNKEYFNAKTGTDFEFGLTAFPKDFDPKDVVSANLRVWLPNHSHNGQISLERLQLDKVEPGEIEQKRAEAWSKSQKALTTPFAIYPVHSSAKLKRDSWSPHWTDSKIAPLVLTAGRGGTDDFQFAVLAGGDSLEPLRIELGEFQTASGQILAPKGRFYELQWSPTLPKDRTTVFEGWYPDMLKPLNDGVLPLSPQHLSGLWGEMSIPADAKPGSYSGIIKLTRNGFSKEIPIAITVNNIEIPKRPTLRTAFWLHMDDMAKRIGKAAGEYPNKEEWKPWVDAALENRITPTWFAGGHFKVSKDASTGNYTVDASRLIEFSDYVIANGGNAVDVGGSCWFGPNIYHFPGFVFLGFPGETPEDAKIWSERVVPPHRKQILNEYLSTLRKAAQKGGWERFAYVQPWDEPNDEARNHHLQVIIPELADSIQKTWPDLRLANTTHLPGNLEKLITMAVPTIPVVDNPKDGGRSWSAALRAEGRAPWFYSCVSYGITIAENGIRDRLIPSHAFDGGADGYLFWGLNKFYIVDTATLRMTEVSDIIDMGRSPYGLSEGFGDGYLLYPSPDSPGEIYPSLRIKAFRSGMEDFEYANRLQVLVNASTIEPGQKERSKSLFQKLRRALYYQAWEDPGIVNRIRSEMGELIDEIEKSSVPEP